MDCAECRQLLQACLDGEPAALDRAGLAFHLSICPDCRERHAAAQCLLDCLPLLSSPRPPTALLGRICRQVEAQRVRDNRRRHFLVTCAVAAASLLVGSLIFLGARTASRVDKLPGLTHLRPGSSLSLQRSLEEAGVAVAALTWRTADETVSETKLLLPVKVPQASLSESPQLEQAFQPPVQSFREIQEGMLAGLEPVATSARRAVGFFLSNRQWAMTSRQ